MVVQAGTRGPGAPGFYCDVCNRTSKDSSSYLNHLNSRYRTYPIPFSPLFYDSLPPPPSLILHSRTDLRKLGQKQQVARSTLDQVRAKIASLREQTKASSSAKQYDFDQRLKEIRDAEKKERQERKDKKKREKEEKALLAISGTGYKKAEEKDDGSDEKMGVQSMRGVETEEDQMAKLMGFSGGFKSGR